MNCTEIEQLPDYDRVHVHAATVSVLAALLDPSVPWVWILGHRPNRYVQWWHAEVPLHSHGTRFSGLVRDLCFDLQLSTGEFTSQAADFDDDGLVLIQSRQPMPDTLCLERIPESEQHKVLIQNGATMRMFLPHAVETALVQSFTRGYLSTAIGTQLTDEREPQ